MFIYTKLAVSIILILILTESSYSLSGSYNVGSGQTYTSLTESGAGGFFNAVNTQGLTGNVTVLITSDITETGAVSLNQWASASFTITISPSSATVRNLTGSINQPLFNLNGADNLTIDGRFSGSGRYLRFVNSNTSGSTFRFISDATFNTITYCIIEGNKVGVTSGVIEFSTASSATANSNNTISNCLIRDVTTSPFGTPQNSIVSNGTTSPANMYNSNNSILNNEISNFYFSGENCTGVYLASGSTDWTISGNSFYQSVTRTPALATSWHVILINTSVARNITAANNYFGGSAANCGGSAWTVTGTTSNTFYGIRFLSASTAAASNVDGNTIANINLTTTPTSNGVIYFAGILIESGLVNIGSTSGNVIGNTTSNGNITVTYNGTTNNLITRGIDFRGRGNVSNNTIGSINLGGTNNQLVRLECINYTGSPTAATDITNNTIGSTTVSNSIQQLSSTFTCQMTGIYSAVNTVTVNMSNNTVSSLRVISTTTTSRIRGIYQNRSTNAPVTMSNNNVSELYCAGSSTNRFPDNCMLIGMFTGSSSVTQTVSGNTIRGLYGTGNSDSYVYGFSFYSNVAKGTFEKNIIYNLNHLSTSGAPKVWAINGFWGSWNFYNNQICLTNGEPTDNYSETTYGKNDNNNNNIEPVHIIGKSENKVINPLLASEEILTNLYAADKPKNIIQGDASTNGVEIKGIHDEAEFPCLYYYNSIYIGGNAASGSAGSWAYDRPLLAWATSASLRNNLFFNARTGGTGKHYAMGNEVGAANWTNTSANYNVYISSNINTIATWGASDQTIQQWRISSSGDKHTWSTISSSLSASNLFTSIASGDLRIKSGNTEAWIVSGKGIAIAGQNTDYEGNTRPTTINAGCTDIGVDEFTATPPSNPTATVDNPPGSGVTSNYTLWERVLLSVTWGTGGSSYPSSLNVRYYSGVDPSGVLGGAYSNSYWSIGQVGTLTGTDYNINFNFGDNETYTISTPSSNTRLASYAGTWEVYPSGTGTWQSDLNWPNLSVQTRNLGTFQVFALTDGTNPLPVELCEFNASVSGREVDLIWKTCSEVNNKGFDIERRAFNTVSNNYNSWVKAGFVDGHGTSNEEHTYNFKDSKLLTGKYQYRLKQIDFNGNYEYHNLTAQSEIIIGTPITADLFQNYPNPSNPTSKVDFQIPFTSRVTLKVYNISGQEVTSLVDKQMDGGFYTAEFNGSNLASGVYFYRLIAVSNDGNKFSKTMKLILIK